MSPRGLIMAIAVCLGVALAIGKAIALGASIYVLLAILSIIFVAVSAVLLR